MALGVSPLAFAEEQGFDVTVDAWFGVLVGYLYAVTFVDVLFFTEAYTLPLAVVWLIVGALFFTLRMGFINIRAFGHAIACVRGKYSNPNDVGETSHFQALTTALSATVGLGNIAGVAIAISIGGPGATFWMIVAGFLGMTAKFTECTLGQMYRKIRPDGRVMGGAMEYLSTGLAEKGWARTGKILAIVFCIFILYFVYWRFLWCWQRLSGEPIFRRGETSFSSHGGLLLGLWADHGCIGWCGDYWWNKTHCTSNAIDCANDVWFVCVGLFVDYFDACQRST